MSNTVTTARFLTLANEFGDLAATAGTCRDQASRLEATRITALEKLLDQQILLQGAIAQLATCHMEQLLVQKNIGQKIPKLNRLQAALERETARFDAACKEGEEYTLQAGRDYAVAFQEHEAHSASMEELARRFTALESQWALLNMKVMALQSSVDEASEAYGDAEMNLEGLRQSTPTRRQMKRAKKAAQQAAVSLFGSK